MCELCCFLIMLFAQWHTTFYSQCQVKNDKNVSKMTPFNCKAQIDSLNNWKEHLNTKHVIPPTPSCFFSYLNWLHHKIKIMEKLSKSLLFAVILSNLQNYKSQFFSKWVCWVHIWWNVPKWDIKNITVIRKT